MHSSTQIAKTCRYSVSANQCYVHYHRPCRLCQSTWVGFSSLSVCLFVCLSVRSITQKRMIPSVQTWYKECPRCDMVWGFRGQGCRVSKFMMHIRTKIHCHSLGGIVFFSSRLRLRVCECLLVLVSYHIVEQMLIVQFSYPRASFRNCGFYWYRYNKFPCQMSYDVNKPGLV